MRHRPRWQQTESIRLFSNLEPDGEKLKHRPGSILGSTALIAGTTVGAGILALPAVTLPSGVLPSTALLMAVWLYALVSGLLIAEVNLQTIQQLGRPDAGLLSMVESTLGKVGARIAGVAYLFLHYALLVAYMAQGGEILGFALERGLGLEAALPHYWGVVLFAALFGGILCVGRERLVEQLNNTFVAIVLASFVGLLMLGSTTVNPAQFWHQDWSALSPAISVMMVALFYHNVIPIVVTQLEGDAQRIRQSIVVGSLIPLGMFLAWNAVILASVSPDILQSVSGSGGTFDPLQVLRQGAAGAWLGLLVSVFSEFAIATSFIGFVYGLLDFFKDALQVRPSDPAQRLPLYSLVLLPSMSLSALTPSIFFSALDYAGTFSISILGGIIPAVMAWKQRYRQYSSVEQASPEAKAYCLTPGGKPVLIVMITVALAIILDQIVSMVN